MPFSQHASSHVFATAKTLRTRAGTEVELLPLLIARCLGHMCPSLIFTAPQVPLGKGVRASWHHYRVNRSDQCHLPLRDSLS